MLRGLRLAASSLRRPLRHALPAFSTPPCLTSTSSVLPLLLQSSTRSFSQLPRPSTAVENLDAACKFTEQLQAAPMDVQIATVILSKIREKDGLGLTDSVASALLVCLDKHKCLDECVELLRLCQEHGVAPGVFAQVATFRRLYFARKFDVALEVFENLCSDGAAFPYFVNGGALDAATKLKRQDQATSIFQRLVTSQWQKSDGESGQVQWTEDGVQGMLRDVRDHGVRLSAYALYSLADFAGKAQEAELAKEVWDMLQQKTKAKLTVDVYGSLMVAFGTKARFNDVMEVFEAMPEDLRDEMDSSALGQVIVAHMHEGSDEVVLRGLEIFKSHKAKWRAFPCNAALQALFKTRQFDDVLALANEMKAHKVTWTPFALKLVMLANIQCGSVEKAKRLLLANASAIRIYGLECYHKLAEYYSKTPEGPLAVCELCVEVVESKSVSLKLSDWCTVLELSLKLPDRDMYWHLRELLSLHAEDLETQLPRDLVFSSQDGSQWQNVPLPKQVDGRATKRVPQGAVGVSLALSSFNAIREADGAGLTKNVATTLLVTMTNHKHFEDCVEMVRYFKQQGVSPKHFALVSAFNAMCDAMQFDKALEVFETLLEEDVGLYDWLYTKALNAAVQTNMPAVVPVIIGHMQNNGVTLSTREFKRMTTNFVRVDKWKPALEVLATMRSEREASEHGGDL